MLDSIAGRDSFEFYCASCHGTGGKGDGPIASALKVPPADLTSLARQNRGAFPRDLVVAVVTGIGRPVPGHGSADMPAWGLIFRGLDPLEPRVKLRIENIVAYVGTLQEPAAGADELGARLFKTHCATCHGLNGRGDGPLAGQLRRLPPDLTRFSARNGDVFPSERLRRIIDGQDVPSHGDREMPVWGDVFRDSRDGATSDSAKARIDAIVKYLQGLQQRAALPGN